MAIVKVQTNIPMVGTLLYADGADGQFGQQIRLTGEWEGHGKASVYLPWHIAEKLMELGLIDRDGKTTDKGTTYKVHGKPRVTISLTEEGRNKRYSVTCQGGATPPPAAAAPTNNGQGTAAPSTAAPSGQVGNSQSTDAESPAVTFNRLIATMDRCHHEAVRIWGPNGTPESVAATCHSLFIAADKRDCLLPPPARPVAQAQLEKIGELAAYLRMEDEALVAEIQKAFGHTDPKKLNDKQAQWLIDLLAKKARAMELAKEAEQATAPDGGEIPW